MTNVYVEIMIIGETSEYLRRSMSSLHKLAQDGRIPCQKVGDIGSSGKRRLADGWKKRRQPNSIRLEWLKNRQKLQSRESKHANFLAGSNRICQR